MSAFGSSDPGAPSVPRPAKADAPWDQGKWLNRSPFSTERCVFWVVEGQLGLYENLDFLFQKRIPVKGLNQTGLNRSDFWFLPRKGGARYGVGGYPYTRGRILNPIGTASGTVQIHNVTKDRLERDLIRKQGKIDVVYLIDRQLYAQPRTLVELALRGTDRSGR